MGHFRVLLSIAALALLSACSGFRDLAGGTDPNGSAPLAGHGVSASLSTKEPPVAAASSAFPSDKLIALTFDDGPRPYVLFGAKGEHSAPGLVNILDQNGVKATFFVVGWRLTPKTWGEPRHEEDIGVTCLDAAQQ